MSNTENDIIPCANCGELATWDTKTKTLTVPGVCCQALREKAMKRFTLDPESGFVYDRDAEEWLTTADEVFNVLYPLLPNARGTGGEVTG